MVKINFPRETPFSRQGTERLPDEAVHRVGESTVSPSTTSPLILCTTVENWKKWSGKRDSNPRPSAWKADALATELFPLKNIIYGVEGEGFEPSKAKPADLQSAPFDRSGTPPAHLIQTITGAGEGTRTPNRLITNEMLYQLSYASSQRSIKCPASAGGLADGIVRGATERVN